MRITGFKHDDNWEDVKNSALTTIHKGGGKYPDASWKKRMLMAEHSPIRMIRFTWKWEGLKSWVSVHIVRHWLGIEHWVRTQRTDRTGIDRDEIPQGVEVEHKCEANAQALINISRKRLCNCAAPETKEAWLAVKNQVQKVEPELANCMVPECIYRGFCPEYFSCGYANTDAYKEELSRYRSGINGN